MSSLGERIKTLRRQQNLTLTELADRIDLSASHLSQIEQDKKMPSLVALTDIAEALEINPRDLLEPNTDQVHIVATARRSNNAKPPPLIANLLLTSLSSGSDLEVQRLVLQAGAPGLIFDPHSGEIFGYVLEGSLAVTLETEKIELEAGDSVHFDANQAYCLQGRAESPCVVIWCSSPPRTDLEQKISALLDDNAGVPVTAGIS